MNMSKKTMWLLCILGLVFTVIGFVAYMIGLFSLLAPLGNPDSVPTVPSFSGMLASLGIAISFLFVGGVIELIGRIGMLIKQAKQQQWAWFVCTLLLGWVCMVIYLIVWPDQPQPLTAPVHTPQYQPMPVYQPYQVIQQEMPGREQYPPQE